MIVSTSDFKGTIELAQINSGVNVGTGLYNPVSDEINILINEKEPEVLTKLLTFSFYRLFRNGINVLPTPDQRWIDLRDGKEWQDPNDTNVYHSFHGLKILAAHYVYYWYQRKNATQTNGVGEGVNTTDNSYRINPKQKQVTAWNAMVEMVKETYLFLDNHKDIYPEWDDVMSSVGYGYWPQFCWNWFCWGGYRCYWPNKDELLTEINTFNI